MEFRPDPDELLKHAQAEEGKRGKLKIFLGYAAGVGKTYAMLEAAYQRKEQGIDVVVGYVETHKRIETEELLEGLDVLPRKQIEYHHVTLSELDVDAVLKRRPQLVLVDEFAHTNAPGSRHPKRYQDVEEILDAGIDVYTTLNIQHLESLNDVVAQVTGVIVRETVPDGVIDEASEIEVIDLPPDELLVRLQEGKVYVPEQAARAIHDDPDLLGVYEGTPLTERGGWWDGGSLPDRITLFRGPLTRMCEDDDELRDEIAVTVVHEIAHHFGIEEDTLHELGWG